MFMDTRKELRLNKQHRKDIQRAVHKYPEKYTNESHFIRIAIIKELRTNVKGN